MRTTVAVIGGGYGGISTAKALDEDTDVVLVEPRETFVHHIAALRALTDPQWTDRLFFGYDHLLRRGRVLRDRAERVDGTSIRLASGSMLDADYVVLATGSEYPFPAKTGVTDSAVAKTKYEATRHALAGSNRVLLLGAGPVALELAGEIKAAWPDKGVTVVATSADIVPGDYPDEFRTELRHQLDTLDVELILGTGLREQPSSEPGEAKTFTATLDSNGQVTADIWFRCFGGAPTTDYLAGELATARRADGRLEVTADLRLPGQQRIFAIGDITATPEAKQASAAMAHADVVADNIRALINGGETRTPYEPGPPGIVLPLGPNGGATYAPGWQNHVDADTAAQIARRAADRNDPLIAMDILDAETTAQIKGIDLMTGDIAALFDGCVRRSV
ncbi:NAD(P)/FAD-dependent oxidoreductase [Plantactinospora sp. CA-290183]|uniref:NAD(P)/FAD-dependent oxidoreductase n=1 Tax=Plantactinospora sp. CA-290183 TaxID=3240006 RepID=UPI003D8A3A0C